MIINNGIIINILAYDKLYLYAIDNWEELGFEDVEQCKEWLAEHLK